MFCHKMSVITYSVRRALSKQFPKGLLQRCGGKVLPRAKLSASTAQSKRKLVLGIETTCDDTGAAVVDNNGNILSDALHSQTNTSVA